MNTGAPWPEPEVAWLRVRRMQRKLHRWAVADPGRRFDDLFNLVYDPAFLVVAWSRVRGNKGARTAGIDGIAPCSIDDDAGQFLSRLRDDLKERRFNPVPVREKMIPKANGKMRRLGIPTTADRIVQAAAKLVLEPVFEADFKPCSYGFRPRRRAQDAIAEIHHFTSGNKGYEWVFEADITACFDEISHVALMDRVRMRIGDKRMLALIKAFLKAGILSEDAVHRETPTGTPQGGILSPLLANIALSVLDEHFTDKWEKLDTNWKRTKHRRAGGATHRIVRYADDFVVLVNGTRAQAEALWDEVEAVLAPMSLRLSEEKTRVCHIDEGFEFLGFRIRRRTKPGSRKRFVYTWPSKKSLASIIGKVRKLTRRNAHRTLATLLWRVNTTLRGWCNYFKHGVSKRTFCYVDHFAFIRVAYWLRKRHFGLTWGTLRRRFWPDWQISDRRVELFRPRSVTVSRYRYRGSKIPAPWADWQPDTGDAPAA
ncbi:group II intron reverse transcriptase/maturase [Nocardia aobensis]|uniref:group II intron reverse transcriptase/maturase n=1 Tax=Nocardia aobensis TaxID=257277 RepID=UPI0002F48E57|nr:group II intron reverse transcriptase/maturase [Nocardia aobensis]